MVKNMWIFGRPNKAVIVFVAGVVTTEVLWQLYKRTRSKTSPKSINEVLFFSEESSKCRMHAVSRTPCGRSNCSVTQLRKLCAYLESAQQNLDVCMYLFSCEDLAAAIAKVFYRGVVVRIIVDGGMAENTACDRRIRAFRKTGIRVRMKKSEYLMHHKFAIIDKKLILTGSTNWTMQAMHGNWDNVIVSNQLALVKPFIAEFDRMWTALTTGEDWQS
ncbi:mitochondrial cardiolipin hydrolase [Diprion similis]|uniref:mitochondrial cardiolipin hydrolase n=1 Tax=Diprion similis TaxID=362088 RepID=UPI001EF8F62C|nr:mitochondrial cardiolipin hydrolase [Diprion similis]XP_046736323.1 mitochondrial cardiolipin hydrolase [Diprion similis]XP_046736324.1 mitochondrial cardiolipin hydrolase [Diprion similis]XP_046736325.1 mitochondrial cardiolipin hydrolase [Diprion similis]XP_046736326.1 mitochondrial cardiolipin hydrolase [Diprion similis]